MAAAAKFGVLLGSLFQFVDDGEDDLSNFRTYCPTTLPNSRLTVGLQLYPD